MSFELGRTINGGAEWLCGSSLIFGTLSNPVITALLITALAFIIIHVMYKDALKSVGWRRGLKAGIWMAIGVSALVFIHYYALERHLRKSHASQGVRDVMASIHQSAMMGGGYSVHTGTRSDDYAVAGDATISNVATDVNDTASVADSPPFGSSAEGAQAMDELGLQQVVLSSAPGGKFRT